MWRHDDPPEGDCRKLVTLEEGGMVWVGIRAFHHQSRTWPNNGELGQGSVIAWQDLPEPASKPNPSHTLGKPRMEFDAAEIGFTLAPSEETLRELDRLEVETATAALTRKPMIFR